MTAVKIQGIHSFRDPKTQAAILGKCKVFEMLFSSTRRQDASSVLEMQQNGLLSSMFLLFFNPTKCHLLQLLHLLIHKLRKVYIRLVEVLICRTDDHHRVGK